VAFPQRSGLGIYAGIDIRRSGSGRASDAPMELVTVLYQQKITSPEETAAEDQLQLYFSEDFQVNGSDNTRHLPAILPFQMEVNRFLQESTTPTPVDSEANAALPTGEVACQAVMDMFAVSGLSWSSFGPEYPLGETLPECVEVVKGGSLSREVQAFLGHLVKKTSSSDALENMNVMALSSRPKATLSGPLETNIVFYTVYLFLWPYVRLVRDIVTEKEKQLKEYLMIMGIPSMALLLSWFLLYFFASIVVTLIAVWLLSGSMFAATQASGAFFFLLLMTFATSMLLFGVAITPVFSQTKTAAASAPLIYLLLGVGTIIRSMVSEDTLASSYVLNFFVDKLNTVSSPVVFMTALHQVLQLDAATASLRPVAWTTVAGSCKTMAVQSLGYLVLGWYLENVFPRTYGVQQKWYFIFLPSYWFPRSYNSSSGADGDATEIMPLADMKPDEFDDQSDETLREVPLTEYIQHFKPILLVHQLAKRYPNGKEALKGVSFGVKKGEIFGLLGPNGAGKSTALSILCGMLAPTSGDAYVGGSLRVSADPAAIRRSLSVCFQQNILFDDLTVWEHLSLVCSLKESMGIKAVSQETWSNKLSQFGLDEKRDALAKTLSGGQKRKLSLVLALLDSARVVLLDEPTAGMDLKARLDTWDALKRAVRHRAVILTTHSMHEAQALCENIGIVANGKLKCCGSSLFLQEKFGVGYKLTIVHHDASRERLVTDERTGKILALVRKYVPKATVVSDNKWEMRMQLKEGKESTFSALFTELEAMKQHRSIKGYAIAATDLEDVFVTVTEGESVYYHAKDDVHQEEGDGDDAALEKLKKAESISGISSDLLREPESWWKQALIQLRALVVKRWKMTIRDKKAVFAQYLWPIVLFAVLMAVIEHLFSLGGSIEVLTRLPPSAAGSSLFIASSADARSAVKDVVSHFDQAGSYPIVFDTNASTWEGMVDEILARNATTFFAGVFFSSVNWTLASAASSSAAGLPGVEYSLFYNQTVSRSLPVALEWVSQAFCEAAAEKAHRSGDQCKLTVSKGVFPLLTNDKKNDQANDDPSESVQMWLDPEEVIVIIRRIMVAFYLLVTMSSIVAYYVSPIVKEKENGLKRLQYQHIESTGGASLIYWTSNMLFDMTGYTLATAGIVVVLAIFSDSLSIAIIEAWTVSLVLFGLAILPFLYLFSLVFASHSSAQSYMSYVSLFQLMAASIVFALSMVPSLCASVDTISQYLQVLPLFTFGIAVLDVATYSWAPIRKQCLAGFAWNVLDNPIADDANPTVWDWDVSGRSFFVMAASAVGYTALLLVLDQQQMYPTLAAHRLRQLWAEVKRLFLCRRRNGYDQATDAADLDVSEGDREAPDMVRVLGVTKVFNGSSRTTTPGDEPAASPSPAPAPAPTASSSSKVVALSDVSFAVEQQDCVALLGVNGSGKSTMFEILTAGVAPTEGKAFIDAFDVTIEPQQTATRYGYCPQGNILFGEMTVREHLELFYRLRRSYRRAATSLALPLEHAIIDALLGKLDLVPVANTSAEHLSGGNKRRLMLALALLSDHTALLLLDEPSAGVDVVARRLMWRALHEKRESAHRTSCLFTTHSMEEAEAVCANAVVLFRGKVVWSGSIPDLKQHAARGISISVRLDPPLVWPPERVQLYTDKLRQWLAAGASSSPAIAAALQDGDMPASELERSWQQCYTHLHSSGGQNDGALASKSKVQGQQWLSALHSRLDHSEGGGDDNETGSGVMDLVEFVKQWLLVEAFVRLEVELFQDKVTSASGSLVTPVALQGSEGSRSGSGTSISSAYETNCSDAFGLAEVFALLEEHKAAFAIAQYSVSELSLERVFEQFT
jgi:ATP-binding cassette subfamily A (ABC1) protein 3